MLAQGYFTKKYLTEVKKILLFLLYLWIDIHWTVCLDLEVEHQKKPVVWRLKADEDWSGLNIHTAVGTCGTLELMDFGTYG